ncbi:Integrin beta-PS [Eumeta japonica]|uniref:Integrin beta n=1 Tax=Eumeta variegata TaxID=151549 RepID=A0A4C1TBM4_EUMVA|nr:Integrin beta-PS [Eumeta japonica]
MKKISTEISLSGGATLWSTWLQQEYGPADKVSNYNNFSSKRTMKPSTMFRKRARWSVSIALVHIFAGVCWSQIVESSPPSNPCSGKSSCSDCIRTAGCRWCSAPDHSRPRCFQPNKNDRNDYCSEEYITDPANMLFISQSRPLTRGKGVGRIGWGPKGSMSINETSSYRASSSGAAGAAEDLVQIRPQRVRLQMRPNEMQQVHFAYSQAQDYPVDLYYLMDLSFSMRDDKEKLSSLGDMLSKTMRNITSNFRLGFGSFVDKLVMPYVMTTPDTSTVQRTKLCRSGLAANDMLRSLRSPCDGCAAPYGYIHAMSLSTNHTYFNNPYTAHPLSCFSPSLGWEGKLLKFTLAPNHPPIHRIEGKSIYHKIAQVSKSQIRAIHPAPSLDPENQTWPKCKAIPRSPNMVAILCFIMKFQGQISGLLVKPCNIDSPEGGFDAIMQAIVCKSQIGWRDQARHLLVFSTDAGYHYAGDGKLGGIVQPNDGLCHLDENGTYTHSKLQDYPSISHINLKVKQHSINLIFAVTASEVERYEELSKNIEGSSCGKLSDHSSNVVDLVKDQYDKISSTVEMNSNASKAVDIKYKSACLGTEGDLMVTNKCDGLKVGDVVHFTAEITLKECPKDPNEWKQTFKIHPVGVSDSLIVELEMLCDCPCEHPGHYLYKKTPDVCEGNGALACGVCLCDASHFGKNCKCSATNSTFPEMERGCRPQNSATGPICSNRGICDCGLCHCNKLDGGKEISGLYCECDNFSCDLNKGEVCSGPEHGRCVCGKCVCDPKYTGSACDCLLDQSPCVSPENGEICSGNGHCSCGKCICTPDKDKHYSGDFCEKCPTCPGRCAEFKDCVLCEVHERGPMLQDDISQAKCGNCSLHSIIEEGKIEANETSGEHLCSFYDDEDCLYAYVYLYDEARQLRVRAQRERECPPKSVQRDAPAKGVGVEGALVSVQGLYNETRQLKISILPIVFGTIAAIVLVGLALLMLWKIATTIHDRREYARFVMEHTKADWDSVVLSCTPDAERSRQLLGFRTSKKKRKPCRITTLFLYLSICLSVRQDPYSQERVEKSI